MIILSTKERIIYIYIYKKLSTKRIVEIGIDSNSTLIIIFQKKRRKKSTLFNHCTDNYALKPYSIRVNYVFGLYYL